MRRSREPGLASPCSSYWSSCCRPFRRPAGPAARPQRSRRRPTVPSPVRNRATPWRSPSTTSRRGRTSACSAADIADVAVTDRYTDAAQRRDPRLPAPALSRHRGRGRQRQLSMSPATGASSTFAGSFVSGPGCRGRAARPPSDAAVHRSRGVARQLGLQAPANAEGQGATGGGHAARSSSRELISLRADHRQAGLPVVDASEAAAGVADRARRAGRRPLVEPAGRRRDRRHPRPQRLRQRCGRRLQRLRAPHREPRTTATARSW